MANQGKSLADPLMAKRGGVELHVGDFPEARVCGDAQYLSQLLTNLVENAIKYAGGRGHHVHVETGCKVVEGQPFSWVQVEDDGPGIPHNKHSQIFQAYFTTKEKGTGLGLATVKHNVELYGGTVRVERAEIPERQHLLGRRLEIEHGLLGGPHFVIQLRGDRQQRRAGREVSQALFQSDRPCAYIRAFRA